MSFGIGLCVIALLLFIGIVSVASASKSQLFSFDNSDSHFMKTASEAATLVLESYDIKNDDFVEQPEGEEVDENINKIDDNDSAKKLSGRTYETNLDNGKTNGRTYETLSDKSGVDMLENFQKNNIRIHSCVEEIKGKRKYGVHSGNDFSVYLSKDIYSSSSVASVCIASYQAVKLSEGVDKPFFFKMISLINFVPKVICQFIWLIIAMIVLGVFPASEVTAGIIGATSIVCTIVCLLDSLYYFELNKIALNKMIKLEILDEAEIDLGKKMLDFIAINETSRFLIALRWFANKILGYRV